MTPDAPESTTQPLTFSVEEVGKRFLKLIEGLESRNDLSLERIREVMDVTMTLEPGKLSAAVASADLGGGWRYIVDFVPESRRIQL